MVLAAAWLVERSCNSGCMEQQRATSAVAWPAPRLAAVAVAAWAVFAAVLGVLALDPPTRVDHGVQGAVARESHELAATAPSLRGASAVLAHLGAAPVVLAVVVTVGALWWLRRRTLLPALLLGGSYGLMALVVSVTKRVLARPEPYDLAGSVGRSFPSGHTASAVVVWGGVALVVWLWGHERQLARCVVTVASAAIVVTVAGVMVGRSAHWLSDVLAGAAVGVASLASVAAAVVSFERQRVGDPMGAASGRVASAAPP